MVITLNTILYMEIFPQNSCVFSIKITEYNPRYFKLLPDRLHILVKLFLNLESVELPRGAK
jgi:hypothetical protein